MNPEQALQTGAERLARLPALAEPLLRWYGQYKRALPWRETITPYRIWVSEIMSQQTRIEAMKGYYERFLAALPTVGDLAAAEDDALLKLWEGLGYYSRARNLKKAARVIVERHGGELPASFEELRKLPGIGEYTAGAVASIAFGIPVPAVDGNVCRVLSRVLASPADTSLPAVKRAFREVAMSMIPPDRPGDFNQALMELGALVCLPNGLPLCGECPLAEDCAAHRSGAETAYPVLPPKKARLIEARTVLLVVADGRLLLFRRESKGLLAGMYEPLCLKGHLEREEAAAAIRGLGGCPDGLAPLPDARHVFSHVEWRMRAYRADCPPFPAEGGFWADGAELRGEYALPSAYRAVLAAGGFARLPQANAPC